MKQQMNQLAFELINSGNVGGDGREVATCNDPTSLGLEEWGVSCSDLSVAVDAIGGELVVSHVPILDYRRTLVKDFL